MKHIPTLLSTLALFFCLAMVWSQPKTQKIGYIRMPVVLADYQPYQETMNGLSQSIAAWQQEGQDKSQAFQEAVQAYHSVRTEMDSDARLKREQELIAQEKDVERFITALQVKETRETERLLEPLLESINAELKTFGKQQGYSLVLGTLDGGNILYGSEASDLTEGFLDHMQNLKETLKPKNENKVAKATGNQHLIGEIAP